MVPPTFKKAPFETVNVPPAIVVPLLAVKAARSSVPDDTKMFPTEAVVEFNTGKFPASVFVSAPLIFKVE